MNHSVSEILGLQDSVHDSTINLFQDISSTKRLELLTTVMKILSSLKNLRPSQIERAYKMAVKDLKYQLEEEKSFFLESLSQLKAIKKIISVHDDEATSLKALICLAQNKDNQLIFSVWSVDQDDRKNIQARLESFNGKYKLQKAHMICLDSKKVKPLSISNNSSIMQISIPPDLLGNSSISAPEKTKEEAINEVKRELQKYPLHSDGLIDDFGNILFKDMFEKLLADPNEATNKKWIRMFKQPISNSWSHVCLKAMRSFFRTY